jgi:hypothetical protein
MGFSCVMRREGSSNPKHPIQHRTHLSHIGVFHRTLSAKRLDDISENPAIQSDSFRYYVIKKPQASGTCPLLTSQYVRCARLRRVSFIDVPDQIGGLGPPPRPTEAIDECIVRDCIRDNLRRFDIREQKPKLVLLSGTVELMDEDVTGPCVVLKHSPMFYRYLIPP